MKKLIFAGLLALMPASVVRAEDPMIGAMAPDFTLTDTAGKAVSLAGLKGKYVVLEWLNDDCPFVVKHYGSKNMQALQKRWTDKGVVWLSVNSSAAGKQGHVDAAQANALTKAKKASPTAVLLDVDGAVGRLYGAKTTPHMYVINPEGTLIYKGAIDDKPSTNAKDVKGAINYVDAALNQSMAGQPVSTAETKPYGCSVKY